MHSTPEIGLYSIIHPGVTLGDGTVVGPYCELGSPDGQPLEIGPNSLIRSHSNVQGGSTIGAGFQTGQYTLIRGGMTIGEDVQIGSNCELQGSSQIGHFVRVQSGVHLGKNTVVEDFVWIFPNVLTVNDPLPPSEIHLGVTFERFAAVAANTLLFPGVTVGVGAFVAASSVVRNDVPPHLAVSGDPARPFATTDRLMSLRHQLRHPWPTHFRCGYSPAALARLDDELPALIAGAREARAQLRKPRAG